MEAQHTILKDTYALQNGVAIPRIGLGTWKIPNAEASKAVQDAVAIGYRHIDTARAYDNEAGVGEGVRACGVPRERLFITSKIPAEVKDYDSAVQEIDASLKALGLETIDLMLIHSPQPWDQFGDAERFFVENREVWRALEEAYEAGKLRAIGVSNFAQVDLDSLLETCSVRPMVNQIRVHITQTPVDLIQQSLSRGMLVEAYSPIAHGNLLENERVGAIAKRYGVSIPQLSIRYTLQLGLLALPKTANPQHMVDNVDVDFFITDDDMQALKDMPPVEN
ncbi:MAG: aldo/keto reductase [Myxococcales bacterium]|nr:aldo/keto reductase [Myxococcales bacterium]